MALPEPRSLAVFGNVTHVSERKFLLSLSGFESTSRAWLPNGSTATLRPPLKSCMKFVWFLNLIKINEELREKFLWNSLGSPLRSVAELSCTSQVFREGIFSSFRSDLNLTSRAQPRSLIRSDLSELERRYQRWSAVVMDHQPQSRVGKSFLSSRDSNSNPVHVAAIAGPLQ